VKRISVVLVVVGALLTVAAPASAQTPPPPDFYVGEADISLSDISGACPGGTTTVFGEEFIPGVPVSIQFDGQEIASVTPGDDGTFSVTITLPEAAAGTHTITAVQPGSEPASATFTCVVAAAPGLAVTGGNVQVWMLLVAGLVVVGAVALVAGRRRARRSA
jgi:hypothetical protein